jgi:hypothetical protein
VITDVSWASFSGAEGGPARAVLSSPGLQPRHHIYQGSEEISRFFPLFGRRNLSDRHSPLSDDTYPEWCGPVAESWLKSLAGYGSVASRRMRARKREADLSNPYAMREDVL